MMPNTFNVWTDGACLNNPGPGGWAYVIKAPDGTTTEASGSVPAATNNRMELLAAIKALEALPDGSTVKVYTDSQYLQKGMTSWVWSWQANGWKRNRVKNKDLWLQLLALNAKHSVSWHWVKGHSGIPENERADQLAEAAALKVQRGEAA